MERNELAQRWCLIYATMPIVFMSEMVLSHLSSMIESYSSSLLMMQVQIMRKLNWAGTHLDLSSTRDYRILLCMIGMMKKMLYL